MSNPKVCDTNCFNIIEEQFSEDELQKIRSYSALIEDSKAALLQYDFVSATHKIHLLLIELNTLVHSTEYWKNLSNKNYVSKIFCIVIEYVRQVAILMNPFLPELSLNLAKFMGFDDSKMFLKFCFFRINNQQMREIYDNETIDFINSNSDLKEFLNEVNNSDKGYFKIHLSYKEKIFITKVKQEIETNSSGTNNRNNSKDSRKQNNGNNKNSNNKKKENK